MIVITGASQPLARALVAALPHTPLRLHSDVITVMPSNHVEIQTGDLRDQSTVERLIAGAETVIHLAPIFPTSADDVQAIDDATRSTYHIANAASAAGVRKIILGSTLDLFARCPAAWHITEAWRPRPTPATGGLRAWLAECVARELARETGVATICLRFGQIVGERELAGQPYDARWLHIEDAVEGVRRALAYNSPGWSIFHITAAGDAARVRLSHAGRELFGYQPRHDFRHLRGEGLLEPPLSNWREAFRPPAPITTRPIQRVVVFGAGGPVAAATASELAPVYTLHLTDVESLETIIARNQPQLPGAPLPTLPGPPHSYAVVDISDLAQVEAACAGADAIINCSVVRRDPVEAFRVNVLGAYNVMRAAVNHGIRRIIHTGPYMVAPSGITSYAWDYEVHEDAPARPGGNHGFQLYFQTKYLGQEICRVFAEYYDLEVLALLFCNFISAETPTDGELYSFSITFADAARAIRCGIAVQELPTPFEVIHVNADLPHGVFPNDKARRMLGWEPQDSLQQWWKGGTPR